MSDLRKTQEELQKMEAELEGVVDINYKRYNNEYMETAAQHMESIKKKKDFESERKLHEADEEIADRLFNKLRGRITV